jgi:hypothetical protein
MCVDFCVNLLSDFNQNRSVSRKFRKNPKCGISQKYDPEGAEFHRAERQT